MQEDLYMTERETRIKVINRAAPAGFIYFVTFIGAAVYFEQHTTTFWSVVGGLLEAIVWPAFVVFHVLQALAA
jgi:hypothetical protein